MSNPTNQEIIDLVELNDEKLREYHFKENPTLLDDDLSDAFDVWVGEKSHSEILDILDEINKK